MRRRRVSAPMERLADAVDTVTVDSYTTLVDIGSQADALAARIEGIDASDAESVSREWRSQYLLYSVIANDIDAYRPFHELIDRALAFALESHGYDVPEATRSAIRETVYEEDITVYDDVTDGIRRIVEAGYDVYVVSNGSPSMLEHLLAAADLEDLVAGAVSAHEVETYKPDPEIYRHAAVRTGTPIDRVIHASGGSLRDVWGAKHAGMRAAWIARPDERYPREDLGQDPDVVVEGFHDLADRLTE